MRLLGSLEQLEAALSREIQVRDRLPNDTAWIFGIVCTLYAILSVLDRGFGVDAHAYWLAWRGPMYTTAPGTPDAYLYSPAFAQVLWPLAQLPWPAFATIMTVGLGVLHAWLLRPLGWRWGIPFWLGGLPEIFSGNIFIVMAAITVIGFRWPASWSLPALTKIAPTVGPLWFLVRREWRQLANALIAIALITAVSVVISPALWLQWCQFLAEHLADASGPIGSPFLPPVIVRFPVGIAIVIWGALRAHRWTIPVAMLLCTPVLWLGSLTLLAAIPRLNLSQGLPARPGSRPARKPPESIRAGA